MIQAYLRLTQILHLTYGLRSAFTYFPWLVTLFTITSSPSTEWQDRVVAMINGVSSSLPRPPQDYNSPKSDVSEGSISQTRRQRRRVDTEDHRLRSPLEVSKSPSESAASVYENCPSWYQTPSPALGEFGLSPLPVSGTTDRRSSSIDSEPLESDSEEELLSAVGQLSMNEDEQIRYHGKASGIYLLGRKERLDQRNEGGIWLVFFWYFPSFNTEL